MRPLPVSFAIGHGAGAGWSSASTMLANVSSHVARAGSGSGVDADRQPGTATASHPLFCRRSAGRSIPPSRDSGNKAGTNPRSPFAVVHRQRMHAGRLTRKIEIRCSLPDNPELP
jgi:hypothetical protein